MRPRPTASVCLLLALVGCEARTVWFGDAALPYVRPAPVAQGPTTSPSTPSPGTGALVDLRASGPIACTDPGGRAVRRFHRRTSASPPNATSWHGSGGVIVADLDLDGYLDIVAPAEPYTKVYRGTPEHDFVEDPVLLDFDLTFGIGGSVADIEGDGDLDLYLLRLHEPNRLLRNEGNGTFTDITEAAGVGSPGPSMASAWADYDGDGDLDLFVGTYGRTDPNLTRAEPGEPSYLYRNEGDGTFADVSHLLPEHVHQGYTYVAGWHDIHDDGWPELYVVNDLGWVTPNVLLLNQGGVLVPDNDAHGLDLPLAAAGLGVGDFNQDGRPDFLISEWDQVRLLESSNDVWIDFGLARGLDPEPSRNQQTGWGAEFADIDNDGDLDGLVAYGHIGFSDPARANPVRQPDALFLQDEHGNFSDVATSWGIDDAGSSRGFVVADFNDDGWLDLVKRDLDGPNVLYLSRCGTSAWLRVALRSAGPNSHAIGARIRVEAGGRSFTRTVMAGGTSYGSGGPPEVHFGLGDLDTIDRIEVVWPDLQVSEFRDVEPRQGLLITRY